MVKIKASKEVTITKKDITAMNALVKRMKEAHADENLDLKLCYELYSEARREFPARIHQDWMLEKLGKKWPDILMPDVPASYWEWPLYSWEIAKMNAPEETPQKIVPKKKRTRVEITEHEVRTLAKEIEEAVGDQTLSKRDIIDLLDDEPRETLWNEAMKLLLESERLEMIGNKKGARYSKFGKNANS